MSPKSTLHTLRRCLMAVVILALTPLGALAQGPVGKIVGTVADDETGNAVVGAQVSVVGTRYGALTDPQGRFVIEGVPEGTYELRASHVGFRPVRLGEVTVRAEEDAMVAMALVSTPIELGGVVVSAGRRPQRITDAPATITKIDARVIESSPGNSFLGALKQVKGIDFVQVGATSVGINARGFNSSFNNRMLMMEDGRISVLPENGLPVGQFTATPKIDLASIEVLVGPGAALYGADASNGVVTLQTKDPREYPGTTVEVTGGSRDYKNVQFRHAGTRGSFGFKAAGEWQMVEDFQDTVFYGALVETGVGGNVNWRSSVARGVGGVTYYRDDSKVEVSAGMSQSDGVGQTNVGRNQLDDWRYNYVQAKATLPRWFFNLYRAQSQSGKSYAINRFTQNKAALEKAGASATDEQIRLMSDWPSNGRLYAAEVQNNFTVPALLGTSFVWGAQVRRDVVSTDGEWLTDRLTGKDVEIGTAGVYAQTETPVMPFLDVVLAGRYDRHDNYDPQFSPKVALVAKPAEGHALRVSYNRAFKSPTILQTNFYIPNFIPGFAVLGNTTGYTVKKADGTVLAEYGAVVPEENETWEIGYKGVVRNRLFVDVAGWRADYRDFISPLQLVNIPALGSLAYRGGTELVVDDAGKSQAALIYFNLGNAELRGADAGVNFLLTRKVNLKATYSLTDLVSIEKVDIKNFAGLPDTAKIRELSSLNSPERKWTLGADFTDLHKTSGGVTVRHVDEYFFASGINKGVIPTFTTVDANLGYKLPWFDTQLTVGVSNLFTCRGADARREGDTDKCGFGEDHLEMINMPRTGTMLFIGMRYQTQ